MRNKKVFIYFIILFLIPLAFSFAQGTSTFKESDIYPCEAEGCTFEDLLKLLHGIVNRLFKYVFILSPLIVSYAGFLLLKPDSTSGDREKAKKILLNVVYGLGVMLIAWTIIYLFIQTFANPNVVQINSIKP